MNFAQPVTVTMNSNEIDTRTNVSYKTLQGMDRGLQAIQRKFVAADDGYAYCKVRYTVEWPDGSKAEFRNDVERTGDPRFSHTGYDIMWNYTNGPGVTERHSVYQALTGNDTPPALH